MGDFPDRIFGGREFEVCNLCECSIGYYVIIHGLKFQKARFDGAEYAFAQLKPGIEDTEARNLLLQEYELLIRADWFKKEFDKWIEGTPEIANIPSTIVLLYFCDSFI